MTLVEDSGTIKSNTSYMWTVRWMLMLTCFFLSTTGTNYSFVQPATLIDPTGNVCVGTSAKLNCTVQIMVDGVNIALSAKWIRDNDVINRSTPRHTLLETTDEYGMLVTGLRVDNTTLNDNGAVYTCIANVTTNSSVILNVTGGPPSLISNITINDTCLTYVTLSWIAFSSSPECGSVSYDVIISPSDGVTMMSITDTLYNFTGLTSNTNYTVTVVGINRAGSGESIAGTFYVPTSEVRNLNYTKVGDGDNTSLIVTWDPAVNPQCGGVLLYLVTISSSCSVMDNIIIVTDLSKSTATFSNLRNIGYNVTVAAVSRTSVGVTSITTTSGNNNGSDEPDDELSTGAVVAISIVVTFIITLVVTALISVIITSLYYKHLIYRIKSTQNVVPTALQESVKMRGLGDSTYPLLS